MNKKHILCGIISVVTFSLLSLPSNGMEIEGIEKIENKKRSAEGPPEQLRLFKKPKTQDPSKAQANNYPTLGCTIKITLITETSDVDSNNIFQRHSQNRLKLIFEPIDALGPFLNRDYKGELGTESPDYLRYGTAIVNYLTANTKKLVVIKLHHLPGYGKDEYKECCEVDTLLQKYKLPSDELKIARILENKSLENGVLKKEDVEATEEVLEEVHKNIKPERRKSGLEDPFIILFEAALGEDVYTVLNKKKEKLNTKEVSDAFEAVAEYLAKLHAKTMKENTDQEKPNTSVVQHMTQTRTSILTDENENSRSFENILETKRVAFNERLQKVRRAVAHNDCHTGNVCYNYSNSQASHQAVTLIDYSGMEETFDFPHDIGKFIASLWQWYARTYTEAYVTTNIESVMKIITAWQEIILEKYVAVLKDENVDITDQKDTDLKEDIKYYKYAQIKKFLNNPKNKDEKEMKNNLISFCLKEMGINPQFDELKESISSPEEVSSSLYPLITPHGSFSLYSFPSKDKFEHFQLKTALASKPESTFIEEKTSQQVLKQPEGLLKNMRDLPIVGRLVNFLSPLEEKSGTSQEPKNLEEIKLEESGSEESAVVWTRPILISENPKEREEKVVEISPSPQSDKKHVNITTATTFQPLDPTPEEKIKAKYARAAAWNVFWPLTNETKGDGKQQLQEAQKKLNETLTSTGKNFCTFKAEYSELLKDFFQNIGEDVKKEKTAIEKHWETIHSESSYDTFYNSIFHLRADLLGQYYTKDNQGKKCNYCKNKNGILIKKILGDRIGECWICGFEDYAI